MKHLIEQRQTLLDILVQHTGTIESLFDFLSLNQKHNIQFIPTGEMEFPSIAKKSVVNQLKDTNTPATADDSIYPSSVEYEPEIYEFMNTIGIPNDDSIFYLGSDQQITGEGLWTALNNLIRSLKDFGIWNSLLAFYPFIGGTAKSHAVNLVMPGLYNIEWSPTVKHSRFGVLFDGISAFGKTNFYTSYFPQPKLAGVFYYNRNDFGSGVFCGSHNRFSPNGSVTILHDTKVLYTWLNSNDYASNQIIGQKGFFVHCRSDEKYIAVYKNSDSEYFSKSSPAYLSTTLYLEEIYLGAANNNGTPQSFSSAQPSAFGFVTGLRSKQLDLLNIAITDFQKQLNRQ